MPARRLLHPAGSTHLQASKIRHWTLTGQNWLAAEPAASDGSVCSSGPAPLRSRTYSGRQRLPNWTALAFSILALAVADRLGAAQPKQTLHRFNAYKACVAEHQVLKRYGI